MHTKAEVGCQNPPGSNCFHPLVQILRPDKACGPPGSRYARFQNRIDQLSCSTSRYKQYRHIRLFQTYSIGLVVLVKHGHPITATRQLLHITTRLSSSDQCNSHRLLLPSMNWKDGWLCEGAGG